MTFQEIDAIRALQDGRAQRAVSAFLKQQQQNQVKVDGFRKEFLAFTGQNAPTAIPGQRALPSPAQTTAVPRRFNPAQTTGLFAANAGQAGRESGDITNIFQLATRPVLNAGTLEEFGRNLPGPQVVRDIGGPVLRGTAHVTSPLELAFTAATAGVGGPVAASIKGAGIPVISRLGGVAAPILSRGNVVQRFGAELAVGGVAPEVGVDAVQPLLENAPLPVRVGGSLLAGVGAAGLAFVAPAASKRLAGAGADLLAGAGARAERLGIPSPISVADAAGPEDVVRRAPSTGDEALDAEIAAIRSERTAGIDREIQAKKASEATVKAAEEERLLSSGLKKKVDSSFERKARAAAEAAEVELATARGVDLNNLPIQEKVDAEVRVVRATKNALNTQTALEVLAPYNPDLDGIIRRGLVRGSANMPPLQNLAELRAVTVAQETALNKVGNALDAVGAPEFQRRRASNVSIGRERQAAAGRAAAARGTASDAVERALGAMEGRLIDPEVTPIKLEAQLSNSEYEALFDKIGVNKPDPNKRDWFDRLRAGIALKDLLDNGILPNESNSRLLGSIFGSEFGSRLLSLRPFRTRLKETLQNDVATILKPIKSAYDISATLRQGGILFWRRNREARHAFRSQISALVSEDNAINIDTQIREHPLFTIAVDDTLDNPLWIGDVSPEGFRGGAEAREEAFGSRLWGATGTKIRKIPGGVGWLLSTPFKGIRMSDRAYTTNLNDLRWQTWLSTMDEAQKRGLSITPEFINGINKWINISTGRGQINFSTRDKQLWARTTIRMLNIPFFAPLFRISRFQAFSQYFQALERLGRAELQKSGVTFAGRTVTETENIG